MLGWVGLHVGGEWRGGVGGGFLVGLQPARLRLTWLVWMRLCLAEIGMLAKVAGEIDRLAEDS